MPLGLLYRRGNEPFTAAVKRALHTSILDDDPAWPRQFPDIVDK